MDRSPFKKVLPGKGNEQLVKLCCNPNFFPFFTNVSTIQVYSSISVPPTSSKPGSLNESDLPKTNSDLTLIRI